MDPVTTTLIVINGGLLLGNGLLWFTSPNRNKPKAIEAPAPKTAEPAGEAKPEKQKPFSEVKTTPPKSLVPENAVIAAPAAAQAAPIPRPETPLPKTLDELRVAKIERRLDSVTTRINTVEERLTDSIDGLTVKLGEQKKEISLFKEQMRLFDGKSLNEKLSALDDVQRDVRELKAKTPRSSDVAAILDAKFREIDLRLAGVKSLGSKREISLGEPKIVESPIQIVGEIPKTSNVSDFEEMDSALAQLKSKLSTAA